MTEAPTNFEPYMAWEKITDEMAAEMAEAVMTLRQSQKKLAFDRSPRAAAMVIQAQHDIAEVIEGICEKIWTVPAMVHIAGAPTEEEFEHSPSGEAVIQRCTRCASILHMWYRGMGFITPYGPQMIERDDVDWWQAGEMIAKTTEDQRMFAYKVTEPEAHEMQCVALTDIEGIS